jgi:hypothetical protein
LAGPRIPSVPKKIFFFVIINSGELLIFQYFKHTKETEAN